MPNYQSGEVKTPSYVSYTSPAVNPIQEDGKRSSHVQQQLETQSKLITELSMVVQELEGRLAVVTRQVGTPIAQEEKDEDIVALAYTIRENNRNLINIINRISTIINTLEL